jgi:hypothetical protein
VALVLGHLAAFSRHTMTQLLVALGLGQADWSGFYRLLSTPRLDYDQLTACFFGQTLAAVPAQQPYVVALDGVQITRHSRTMPGTSWLPAAQTAPWRRGIERRQRFVDLAWLAPPAAHGYSRAIPLRWDPALPAKAVPAPDMPPKREWEVGLAALQWTRRQLDAAGRDDQRLLGVADSLYGPKAMWANLPARTSLLTRCAKNRALFALPPAPSGRGRRRKYGDRAPAPADWVGARSGWQHTRVMVRGREIGLTYRVAGPYLVKGAPTQPLYLLVVKGVARKSGARREPTFWLVSAVQDEAGAWVLPFPAKALLGWAWQRWEPGTRWVAVTHREGKTGFGIGEVQCWSPHSALGAVQWQVWVYSTVLLTAHRAWGLDPAPVPAAGRWWAGPRRWTLGQVWQALRAELWQLGEFEPVWAWTAPNWTEMAAALTRQTNAVLGARRG